MTGNDSWNLVVSLALCLLYLIRASLSLPELESEVWIQQNAQSQGFWLMYWRLVLLNPLCSTDLVKGQITGEVKEANFHPGVDSFNFVF
jgi:hypothetical protein